MKITVLSICSKFPLFHSLAVSKSLVGRSCRSNRPFCCHVHKAASSCRIGSARLDRVSRQHCLLVCARGKKCAALLRLQSIFLNRIPKSATRTFIRRDNTRDISTAQTQLVCGLDLEAWRSQRESQSELSSEDRALPTCFVLRTSYDVENYTNRLASRATEAGTERAHYLISRWTTESKQHLFCDKRIIGQQDGGQADTENTDDQEHCQTRRNERTRAHTDGTLHCAIAYTTSRTRTTSLAHHGDMQLDPRRRRNNRNTTQHRHNIPPPRPLNLSSLRPHLSSDITIPNMAACDTLPGTWRTETHYPNPFHGPGILDCQLFELCLLSTRSIL